jgi:hypothetical protein
MKKPKFYNQNGTLTIYARSCGYIEKEETETNEKNLYIEHSHIHVRAGKKGEYWPTWEVFEINELTKARKFYKSLKLN